MTTTDYVWISGQALLAWGIGYFTGQSFQHYKKFFASVVE